MMTIEKLVALLNQESYFSELKAYAQVSGCCCG
jgi:hypothetical protein